MAENIAIRIDKKLISKWVPCQITLVNDLESKPYKKKTKGFFGKIKSFFSKLFSCNKNEKLKNLRHPKKVCLSKKDIEKEYTDQPTDVVSNIVSSIAKRSEFLSHTRTVPAQGNDPLASMFESMMAALPDSYNPSWCSLRQQTNEILLNTVQVGVPSSGIFSGEVTELFCEIINTFPGPYADGSVAPS
ncbi:hypothetical protein OTU49_001096 [Cherax quadricarinatus]|uniref:Uncharacterized protein n=1 Tax=Cherax quadricarinatus TaxID=27406 RepID=A0AAW0XWA6_CHEQU